MISQFDEYIRTRWATNPKKQRGATDLVPYPMIAALGLGGEVGEVMELLKKHLRDGKHPGTKILLELGDVLHYLTVIAASYDLTLSEVAAANIQKLKERDERVQIS